MAIMFAPGYIERVNAKQDMPDKLKDFMCVVFQNTKAGKVQWTCVPEEYTCYWRGIEIGALWLRFNIPDVGRLSYLRTDICSHNLYEYLAEKYNAEQIQIDKFIKEREDEISSQPSVKSERGDKDARQ